MYPKERTEELREKSGNVNIDDALTVFLYLLMRNELAVGKVEELVMEAVNNPDAEYTNGWLARYAFDLAEKITSAKMNNLKTALDQVFEEQAKVKKGMANKIQEKKPTTALDEFDYEELKKLEEDIVKVAEQESKGEETQEEFIEKIIQDSYDSIQEMVETGGMSEEQANKLKEDVLDAVKSIQRPDKINPEELIKEISEEEKITKEEAEELVEKAVEVAEKTEPLDLENAQQMTTGEPPEKEEEK